MLFLLQSVTPIVKGMKDIVHNARRQAQKNFCMSSFIARFAEWRQSKQTLKEEIVVTHHTPPPPEPQQERFWL